MLDERKFLEQDELARLRRHVRGRVERAGFKLRLPWLEWFFTELAFETGLRVAEMADLKCSDLVLSMNRPGVFVRRGKGGKSRFVRVRKQFVQVCEDYLHWKSAIGEPAGNEDPVIRSSVTSRHMTTRGLQKMFERLCLRTGIEGHSVHHSRHTYASVLYRSSGRDLQLVKSQLGHSSTKVTEVYAHVFDQDIDLAMKRLYA